MTTTLINDIKEALRNGAAEIERLRRENALLAAKAQALDTLSGIVALAAPRANQGHAPDAAWILRKVLADVKRAEMAPAGNITGPAGATAAGEPSPLE
jgi:hypothetical protein